MKVFYGIKNIHGLNKPVVALGVFDGVHLAHLRILKVAVKYARQLKVSSLVFTFWPHPQKKPSIYSLEHRLRLISEAGIDASIVVRFNKAFARLSAKNFIEKILLGKLKAGFILVGKNFRFGRGAKGDYKLLKKFALQMNFKLKVFPVIKISDQPISSTLIRKLIIQGNLRTAEKLLGRPVSVLGTVIKGDSVGRILGFPTANVHPHHEVLPPPGIYAAKVRVDNSFFKGVCYIGSRPTLKNEKEKNIEVFIFDFKDYIYGKNIEVYFLKRIREEKKFASPLALIKEIRKDILRSKNYFSLPK